MPPYKIRFAFFGAVGISLFYHEINIFNVTETIVSRETNAIAVRVSQRSERRQIEKTLGFWKRLGKSARLTTKQTSNNVSETHPIIIIPFIRDLWTVNRKAPKYPTEN